MFLQKYILLLLVSVAVCKAAAVAFAEEDAFTVGPTSEETEATTDNSEDLTTVATDSEETTTQIDLEGTNQESLEENVAVSTIPSTDDDLENSETTTIFAYAVDSDEEESTLKPKRKDSNFLSFSRSDGKKKGAEKVKEPKVWKDYTFLKKTKRFYKAHLTPTIWREAAKTCRDEGAILFYPENFRELNEVKNWLKDCSNGAQCLSDEEFNIHVGLTDKEYEGQFVTVDGRPIDDVYDKWLRGQPDNDDHGIEEDCVMLRSDNNLNDIDCEGRAPLTEYPFICKQELNYNTICDVAVPDGENADDYQYIEKMKKFYKIHTPTSWMHAKQKCEDENAILFHPENEKELNIVRTWWKDCKKTPNCLAERAEIHVGITDEDQEGVFKTLDGKLIKEVYHKWGMGQPDNDDNGKEENCAILQRDSTLNDIDCRGLPPMNRQYDYICTKKCPYKPTADCDVAPSKKDVKQWRGYTYKAETHSYYKVHNLKKSWLDAKAHCESEEALLFYPDDADEAEMIRTWWAQISSDDMTPRDFPFIHMGVSDLNSTRNGKYVTVDGIPIEQVYHEWGRGEPNNAGGIEHCGQLCYNLDVNDVKCDGKASDYQSDWFYLPFICKKKLRSPPIETNYKHSFNTGSCYSLQLQPLSWTEAEAACAGNNAHLAIINSQDEADFLVQMVAETPTDHVTGDFLRGAVHLGFHSRRIDYWETVTGQYLYEAGYAKWGNQQPDGEGVEKCGSMFPSGRLNDIGCDAVAFYICEREPEVLNE